MVTLTVLLPTMSTQIVAILARRACEALTPVRSIPSQFRAMSNKKMPIEPSYFVSAIMHPVKAFFGLGAAADGAGAGLKADYLRPYAEEVFDAVVQRCVARSPRTSFQTHDPPGSSRTSPGSRRRRSPCGG
jgi:hypothetical protein